MVVTDLSQSPDVEVLGTDRLYQILRELHRADDRVVSSDTAQELARRAGVKTFVLGSYMKAGDAIRINIKLQEAASGRILSAERVEAVNEAQLFPAVDDLTRRIQAKFALQSSSASASREPGPEGRPSTVSGIDRDLADVTTSSIEAYRYYADGVGLHERGRDVEAIAQLRRAVALDPGFAMALTKLALAEIRIGDWASVGNDSQRALDHADRLSVRERYYVEAVYYVYHGQLEKAIESNKKLLALFPEHVSARNNLAVAYSQLERYEEALPHLEDLRRRGVALSPTYVVLAGVYEGLGQFDKGLEVVQEFLHRNPDNALAHQTLAGFLARMGKTDEALAALAKAEALDPAEPWIYDSHRTILLLKDQVADVEAADRKRLAANDPIQRHQAIVNVADDVLFRGRTDEALKLLGSPPALLLERGQTERALVEARRGLANATGSEVVTPQAPPPAVAVPPASAFLAVIARAQARLGRNADATQTIDQLTRTANSAGSRPEKRRVLWLTGAIALDRQDTTTALRDLTQAQTMLEANPGEKGVPIWFALGSAYLAAGKDADAAPQFQRIVDSSARVATPIEFVRSLYFHGQIAERQGDRDKARAYYRRFVGYWSDGDIDRDRVAEARKKIATN